MVNISQEHESKMEFLLTQLRESEKRLQNNEDILRSSFESRQKKSSSTRNQSAAKRSMVIRDFDDNHIDNEENGRDDEDFYGRKIDGNNSHDGNINMSTLNSYLHQHHEGQEQSSIDHDYSQSRSMTSSPEKSLKLMSTSEHSMTSSSLGQGRALSFDGKHYFLFIDLSTSTLFRASHICMYMHAHR